MGLSEPRLWRTERDPGGEEAAITNNKYLLLLPIVHLPKHLLFTRVDADSPSTLYQIVVLFHSIVFLDVSLPFAFLS